MPKYNNQEVITRFFINPTTSNGKYIENHSGSLYISLDGKRLMNYGTVLAERHAALGKLIINTTSYSNTTSKIQSWLRSELWSQYSSSFINENVIYVDNVQMGTTYLEEHAKLKLEWLKGMKQTKLINYFDVWGNKKDGWEINNMCEEENMSFEIHKDASDKEIVQALKSVGFFKSTVRMNQLMIEDLGEMGVEIYQKKDQQPVCRVEFVGGRY